MSRTPAQSLTDPTAIAALMKLMGAVLPAEALGVAAAVFFSACQHYPDLLRPILNEPVIKQGFMGQTLLGELTRVARS